MRIRELGLTQGVAPEDPRVLNVMHEQVHPGDRGGGEVDLLPVQPERPGVPAQLLDLVDGLHEHPGAAAGRVIDALSWLRVEDPRHEPHDTARSEELPSLLAACLSELAQQVLVRRAEHVVGDGGRVQWDAVEDVDQVREGVLGEPVLVRPGDLSEDAAQGPGVGLLDPVKDQLKFVSDVLGDLAQVRPVATLGDDEPVVVGVGGLGHRLRRVILDSLAVLRIPVVGEALEEQQREDVLLEVSRIHGAAQRVRGGEQARFKFCLCERHCARGPSGQHLGQVVDTGSLTEVNWSQARPRLTLRMPRPRRESFTPASWHATNLSHKRHGRHHGKFRGGGRKAALSGGRTRAGDTSRRLPVKVRDGYRGRFATATGEGSRRYPVKS